MECFVPVFHRLWDLTSHPDSFLLLTHNLYLEYATSFYGPRLPHALPALLVLVGVTYRFFQSKKIYQIRRNLRWNLQRNVYLLCNFLFIHWMLNVTLVSFLSLQDFVYCATDTFCREQKSSSLPAWLQPWTKEQGSSCAFAPTHIGLFVVGTIAITVTALLCQSDLTRFVAYQLQQQQALSNWFTKNLMLGAAPPMLNRDSEDTDSNKLDDPNSVYLMNSKNIN